MKMKIANSVPKAVKRPVRVTDSEYDLYYSKPVNLGKIVKKGIYWYTEDGMRFVSSRDALEYRIRVVESVASGREPSLLDKEQLAKAVRRKNNYPARKPGATKQDISTADPVMYQKFLEFMRMFGETSKE
jgi:hypothetical protein